MKLIQVKPVVKRAAQEVKGQRSITTVTRKDPALRMGSNTFTAVQEWFDSDLKYSHWYCAEKIAKPALSSYCAY